MIKIIGNAKFLWLKLLFWPPCFRELTKFSNILNFNNMLFYYDMCLRLINGKYLSSVVNFLLSLDNMEHL